MDTPDAMGDSTPSLAAMHQALGTALGNIPMPEEDDEETDNASQRLVA